MICDAVSEHVKARGEHGSSDREDCLLGAAARLEAEELGAKVAFLLADLRPSGGDEGGLEPGGALADPR